MTVTALSSARFPLVAQRASSAPPPEDPPADTFVHSDSSGKIKHLALQLDAQATPRIKQEVQAAWTQLFKTMDSDVKFTVSLERESDKQALQELLKRQEIANPERFQLLVNSDLNITMWARDQMIGLGNRDGGNTLLGQTTMRPHGDDELLPPRIAAAIPGLAFDPDKRLQTDGGDEVSNSRETFLGYNSLFLTAQRLYESSRQEEAQAAIFNPFEQKLQLNYQDAQQQSPDYQFSPNPFRSQPELQSQEYWLQQAHELFEQKYGKTVTVVGADDPSTPEKEQPATFHIDMGLTPVDSDTFLVGDPSLAIEAIRGLSPQQKAEHNARLNAALGRAPGRDTLKELVKENTSGEPLLQHNFDVNARTVEGRGYEVERLPYLQGSEGASWITYNNCLMEDYQREDGSPVRRVFLPTYDLPVLDQMAQSTYEKHGYEVIPLKLPALTSWRGAIRCISNVIDRDDSSDQALTNP